MRKHRPLIPMALAACAATASLLAEAPAQASSHMDAPLVTLDDAANTTDVYAFVTQPTGGAKFLSAALAVYPFEEPGIGPNNYNFDDNVNYEIHVALGPDVALGRPTLSYQFEFQTTVKNRRTVLQSFTGDIENVNDANQNLVQRYTVRQVDYRSSRTSPFIRTLGTGIVPPNNQGTVTLFYNQGDNGEQPAKPGVATAAQLDRYTAQSLATLDRGHRAFAGQRDDGFYADIQSVFDLLRFRQAGSFDSQGGFNVHTIALNIPVTELGGDQQVVGVYATTSRAPIRIISVTGDTQQANLGLRWAQVGRQGNPLFCEALVAVEDKDRYNRTSPASDSTLFRKYAETPELAALINARGLQPAGDQAITTGRTDLSAIFIPDLIKTDLSTPAARLAGGGASHPTNPDDAGFSRLSVFGGDTLPSTVQTLGAPLGRNVPGGWPNGRRFGDDVIDIAVSAILSDLRPILVRGATGTPEIDPDGNGIDRVSANDIAYNKVFPYAATPHNGRNHPHH